jgi:hypothetical protein
MLRRAFFFAVPVLLLGPIGCDRGRAPAGTSEAGPAAFGGDAAPPAEPALRLVLISDLAGALSPCACVKDQLGGFDHLGAWVHGQHGHTVPTLLAAAGPLFFSNVALDAERADQDRRKAATIASVLRGLRLAAFAPGVNDWADGEATFARLAQTSGAAVLAASAADAPAPLASATVREAGGLKVGFIGFGPRAPASAASSPGDVDPRDAIARGIDEAKRQGANVLVALAAVGRDEAKRIAAALPELTAIVVGSPKLDSDANASVPQGEQVGGVLIAAGGNHLQAVGVLDLFVRERVSPGRVIPFADAVGLSRGRERQELATRIDGLHEAIAVAGRDPAAPKASLEAQRRELARLEQEQGGLDALSPPAKGSFYHYSVREVRESMGTDTSIQIEMGVYANATNTHNQAALAGRKPRPRAKGQPGYVGTAACARCHAPAFAMWKRTGHTKAYTSLSVEGREFDLECIGCHVTGYEQPGGSTVTHIDKLDAVQCEACHGPGSEHVDEPLDEKAIIAKPGPDRCVECHRPPYVEPFDAVGQMKAVLGPGHGEPLPSKKGP